MSLAFCRNVTGLLSRHITKGVRFAAIYFSFRLFNLIFAPVTSGFVLMEVTSWSTYFIVLLKSLLNNNKN